MNPTLRQAYLEAMGIQSWIPRVDSSPSEDIAEPASEMSAQAPVANKVSGEPEILAKQPASLNREETPPDWLDAIPLPDDEYAPSATPTDLSDAFAEDLIQESSVSQLNWTQLEARVAECTACELHKTRTQTVFGIGSQSAKLMVIGEAPGAEEDRKGEPFVGRAGQLLTAMLGAIGLSREQVYIANILKCRPPGNRDPRSEESLSCAAYLQRQIALVNPRVILAVGAVAAHNLLQSDEPVGRLRGKSHQLNGVPVVVSYHPAYLLRSPDQKAKAWQDLQQAARILQ
ncbi:MAG: uracil-DNA glycosylase [Sedimenticola sp.]|nr:uracil-DNA glycosylase [Sedimenticola sp.]MCW9022404.1 uracil-DNA glycosylase [Sedimenticola sp.]